MLSVFIDSNAWDHLFAQSVDLAKALPSTDFCLLMTREAEFEIECMPQPLKDYVQASISASGIKTDTYFGFPDESISEGEQRTQGFGIGRLADITEVEILHAESSCIKSTVRPTGLFKNEADVSLAARSAHSIILTSDKRKALGRVERVYGGTVVDLKDLPNDMSLSDYIRAAWHDSADQSPTPTD